MIPTQNLVDMYEMANGLTKEEPGSGYDPTRPFSGRDPRMAMTILYPGRDWVSGYDNIINTLDRELPRYLPIPQGNLDNNPQLTQNQGY